MQDGSFVVASINKPVQNLKGILPKPKTPLSIEDMNEAIKSGYDRN